MTKVTPVTKYDYIVHYEVLGTPNAQSTAFSRLWDGMRMVSNGVAGEVLPGESNTKGRADPMRRTIPYLKTTGSMQVRRLRASEITKAIRSRVTVPLPTNSRECVDEILLSGLLSQDKELARILKEVDEVSKSMKSEELDAQTLSDTLQRTVLYAIKRSLVDRELRSLALKDDLTCLYNRRAFLALAGQQFRVARRNAQGLLLFFADVDNLKEINDTYGHQEGDVALIRVANALELTFRNSDVLARLGGDEFAVLALEASCEDREAMLHRLAKSLKIASSGETRYELSLSIGMARFDPKHPVTLGKLIANADEAMYEEKKSRRARTFVADGSNASYA